MRFVFHCEVLPRRRRDPPGCRTSSLDLARHNGRPAFGPRGHRELRKINKVQEVCAPAGRDLDMSGRIGRAIVCFAAAGTLLYATSKYSAGSMAWRASSLLTPPSTAGEKEAPAVAYLPETPQIAETTSSVPIATVAHAKPIRAARKPRKPTKPGLLPAPASGMAIQFSLAERGN
jgi:hypothetical protein